MSSSLSKDDILRYLDESIKDCISSLEAINSSYEKNTYQRLKRELEILRKIKEIVLGANF